MLCSVLCCNFPPQFTIVRIILSGENVIILDGAVVWLLPLVHVWLSIFLSPILSLVVTSSFAHSRECISVCANYILNIRTFLQCFVTIVSSLLRAILKFFGCVCRSFICTFMQQQIHSSNANEAFTTIK